MLRRLLSLFLSLAVLFIARAASADELPILRGVEAQPLKAQVRRVAEALEYLGEPLSAEDKRALDKAAAIMNEDEATEAIQKVLDKRCLAGVNINPESRVKVARGSAPAELVEQGGTICYGALGVGGTKMKIHRAAIQRLYTANNLVLNAEQVFEIGQEITK